MASTLEDGLLYALLALGVFLTYRILNFADLTVDGSFTTGAATTAVLIVRGVDPVLATLAGFAAGALAGLITAILHTRLKIDPLLASILTMIGLYSINLRIMWYAEGSNRSNLSLGRGVTEVFTPLQEAGIMGTGWSILILAVLALVAKLVVDWFLQTNLGLAVQATGDNPQMAASFGVSTNLTKTVTLMIANGLVGLSGSLIAQKQGFADIGMGTGLILVGLASVIVGNAILGTRFMFLASLGVIVGSVLYRLIIFVALKWHILSNNDMKLISAALVVIALVLSRSKTLKATVTRLSPWGHKDTAPEPMLAVPGNAPKEP